MDSEENLLFEISVYVYICVCIYLLGLPRWVSSKESACNAGDTGVAGSALSGEYALEEEMATHSSTLA